MLAVFGKGHLGFAPEKVIENATGDYYRVRIGINRVTRKKGVTEPVKESLWCSGLVHKSKVQYQMQHLVKGAPVTFLSSKSWYKIYQDKQGNHQFDVDLGFLASFEVAGKLPSNVTAPTQETQNTMEKTEHSEPQNQAQQMQTQNNGQANGNQQNQGSGNYPGNAPQPVWNNVTQSWELPTNFQQNNTGLPF